MSAETDEAVHLFLGIPSAYIILSKHAGESYYFIRPR